MKLMFAGGGTAGHINPALAIAGGMKKRHPSCEILFVGTKAGMESRLVPEAGFEMEWIDVLGFKRKLGLSFVVQNTQAVGRAVNAIGKCGDMIRRFSPDAVIGTGGYVSAPLLWTAQRMGIPTLIHEQNVFPGMTSKILSRGAAITAISFEESRVHFPRANRTELTGNPLREELFGVDRAEARAVLGADQRPLVVAFGGSLGAERMSEEICALAEYAEKTGEFKMLFGTGRGHYDEVKKKIGEKNTCVTVVPYIDNMAQALAAADLVIGRAGAITVSELTALGKPSVLIPSPNVTHNHQEYNARALERAGAAVVLTESELSEGVLTKQVRDLLRCDNNRALMAKNALKIGISDGTQKLCGLIEELLEKKAD